MKPTLYLCGAGNLEGIRLALRINEKCAPWEKIIILDDNPAKHGQSILGLEVAGPFALLGQADMNSSEVANLVSRTTAKRESARQKIKTYPLPFAPLIDPTVDIFGVEYTSDISIYQGAIFAAGAFVDESSVVFLGAMVGHGCRIGKGCIIAPGAIVNARVQLEDGVYVGTNASILPDLRVGPWATIGANSAVVEDVPGGATVMGVPAKVIMTLDEMHQHEVSSAPKKERPESVKDPADSRSSIEKKLAKLWGQILGREYIGRNDNFFDLGGDSILAIQTISRANQAGINLTVRQLLDHQTIAELAEIVSSAGVIDED